MQALAHQNRIWSIMYLNMQITLLISLFREQGSLNFVIEILPIDHAFWSSSPPDFLFSFTFPFNVEHSQRIVC